MQIIQQFIHYFLHLILPFGIALLFFPKKWKAVYLVFLLTMLVDADHLFANPVFSVCRCSIGFHPLHSYPAIILYATMLLHPKLRIVAIGLLMHMVTDKIDCLFINMNCK